MRKRGILAFLILSVILFTSIIGAQAPGSIINVNTAQGYQIFFPQFSYLPEDTPFNLHIHVSNISTGFPLSNTDVDCRTHLYNPEGNHTLESGIMDKDSNLFDHEILISAGNFTEGTHSLYVWCNDSTFGGEIKRTFEVTNRKLTINTAEALLYILLVFGVLMVFLLSLYFAMATPYANKTNEKGAVIKITKLKYVKLGFIMLSYVLFVWVLNVLIGVSDNFVSLSMFYGFVSFFFLLLNYLALPFSIFIIVLAGFEIIRDTNVQKTIKKLGSTK